MRRAGSAVLLAAWAVACAPPTDYPPLHVIEGSTMGTTFALRIVAEGRDEGRIDALREAVERALAGVDGRMSTWLPESELSRFNRLRSTEPFPVSADTLAVFRHALEISAMTGGRLRRHRRAAGRCLGIRSGGPSRGIPGCRRDRALAHRASVTSSCGSTGPRRPCASCTRCSRPTCRRSPRGTQSIRWPSCSVASGSSRTWWRWAGKCARAGAANAATRGASGIERPASGLPAVQRLFGLSNLALATSGDYRNYYEVEGRRLSHTIDPRTGRPVTHRLASASVIDPLCVRADALATALGVLGAGRRVRAGRRAGLGSVADRAACGRNVVRARNAGVRRLDRQIVGVAAPCRVHGRPARRISASCRARSPPTT